MKENKKLKKYINNKIGVKIFMDYAASTPVDVKVLKVMNPYFTDSFCNAGSIYSEGVKAKNALDNARKKVADILNAKSEEIIFTSGGTESNNLAIFGIINAFEKDEVKIKDMHAITSVIEHPSVLESFRALEKKGLKVTYIKVNEKGIVSQKEIKEKIMKNTVLVSIMHVNNEIGTIQPISEIAKILRHKKKERGEHHLPLYFHTDASQAPLYLSLDSQKLGVDLMTLGGQKIYGPKGIGCLYKKRNIRLEAIIKGGNQEGDHRAGTENTPLIIGFAKALDLANKDRIERSKNITILRDYFINKLDKKIPQAKLNGSAELRSPNNVNIYVPGINGEFFVLILDRNGISCATRSACKEGDEDEGSYVVQALGYDKERSKSSLRFSLGKTTTKKDVDYVVGVLGENVGRYPSYN